MEGFSCIEETFSDRNYIIPTFAFTAVLFAVFQLSKFVHEGKNPSEFASYAISNLHVIAACFTSISLIPVSAFSTFSSGWAIVDTLCFAVPFRNIFFVVHHLSVLLFQIVWWPYLNDIAWIYRCVVAIEWSVIGLTMAYYGKLYHSSALYALGGYQKLFVWPLIRGIGVPINIFIFYQYTNSEDLCAIAVPYAYIAMGFVFSTALYFYVFKIVANIDRTLHLRSEPLEEEMSEFVE